MCWENTSGIWQSDRLTPTYAKPYANSPAICVEICRAVKMERRRNGVNKGFANDYERLYKAGISNPLHKRNCIRHGNDPLPPLDAAGKTPGELLRSGMRHLRSGVRKPF